MKMIKNSIGRWVPDSIPVIGALEPYAGPFSRLDGKWSWRGNAVERRAPAPGQRKLARDLREAIERSGLSDGMTISFHHHLRNGDAVLPEVMRVIEDMGIRDLVLAPSSLIDPHDCVADFVRRGVIKRLHTSGVRGEVGKLISHDEIGIPAMIHSHGGRARAMEEGRIAVDVAFLGVPTCDPMGNGTGWIGKSACGSLGYAIHDARNAAHVVAVTDNLVKYPLHPEISIPEFQVHQVVQVDTLGDPRKIAAGSARITRDPLQLRIAENAFNLIAASGLLAPGCSFQVGAGGASLAVARFVKDYMKEKSIRGSFGLGGISGYMAEMLKEDLFDVLYDTQSFDVSPVRNPRHIEIDVSWYANPFNAGCIVNILDVVVLAALDVDVDFNVDVLTGYDGCLMGASGGHSDTAAGSKLSVIVVPAFRQGVPSIRERVQTVVTPGETVDAIVTERGICINPRREDLMQAALKKGLPVKDIRKLKAEIESVTGVPDPVRFDESKVVGVVEYRDGTIIDSIYKVVK